jgi:hypothetical protein
MYQPQPQPQYNQPYHPQFQQQNVVNYHRPPPPPQQYQQQMYYNSQFNPQSNSLEIQNNGSFNMKQKITPNFQELDPQKFTSLYNNNTKSQIIENVFEDKLPNGLPKLETQQDIKFKVRNAIRDLYSNLIMTKVQDIPSHRLSVYKAVVEPLTSGPDVKYLVAFVPNDSSPVSTEANLSELDWINFQTRSTMDPEKEFNKMHLRPQRY